MPYSEPKITFNRDHKFDIQLSAALIAERRLAEILQFATFDTTIEVKSEHWQWEQTGNIAIEYMRDGKLSGIATTEADYWVHELRRKGETVLHILVRMDRMKDITRAAIHAGQFKTGGDGNRQTIALLNVVDLLS